MNGPLPCPFCGAKATVEYGYCDYNVFQVCCTKCHAMNGWSDTPEKAIEEWNRRKLIERSIP